MVKGMSINNPISSLILQLNPRSSMSVGLHWREYTSLELREILNISGFDVIKYYYCHLNNNKNPSNVRDFLVKRMYALFPSFLPSQVVIAQKINSKNICDVVNSQ